jgi:hypothetical protein
MSSPGAPDIVIRTGPGVRPAVVPAPRPHHQHDSWLHIGPGGAMTLPPAGHPGHGRTAFVRRQPARIADGRFEGGYTGLFELICPGCGDHPYLDYSEIPPRLQWLRGPRTLEAALVASEWGQCRELRLSRRSPGKFSAPNGRTGQSEPESSLSALGRRHPGPALR